VCVVCVMVLGVVWCGGNVLEGKCERGMCVCCDVVRGVVHCVVSGEM
jgi:hypothetical protein